MKAAACTQLFQAEAMRDQRLGPAEAARFERHLATCAVCAREVRVLEAVAEPLRAPAPAGAVDELHARRERTRLLSAFERQLLAPEPRMAGTNSRRWLLPAAAAIALVAAGAALWRARPSPELAVAVQADSSAIWSRHTEGARQLLVLDRGTLVVRVHHPGAQEAPLLVALPDGELEDIGTVFTITVDAGRTTHVSVSEGSVVLRIRGQAARVIGAGETWLPDAPIAAPACASTAAPAPVSAPAPTPASAPLPPKGSVRRDPAREFRAALALLESDQQLEAAAAFDRFAARYPRDARAEDAAYLRVLALHKAGAHAAMKTAAQRYLRNYPAGLRHVEVEQWSNGR